MASYNKSYPKDFRTERMSVQKERCFFIMPFSEAYDIVYANLKDALQNNKYIPVRVDDIAGSEAIMNKIMSEILISQYIIVDMSSLNPNVFYELGIAHCFKEPRNVILIKNKEFQAPSDIRHMTYIEYDQNNLMLLKENIIKTLESKRHISELGTTLTFHNIISSKDDESIINIIDDNLLQTEIILMCDVLNGNFKKKDSKSIKLLVEKLYNFIEGMPENGFKPLQIETMTILFIVLLSSCSRLMFIPKMLENLLYSTSRTFKESSLTKFRTDLAIEFVRKGEVIDIAMQWIIEYFSQSKSTHIDLNRYNLESFLLNNKNRNVDEIIINAVLASDRHIREHMADIIGEKHLSSGRNNLRNQLDREGNIYTAASLMEALGKVGQDEDINQIFNWIENNLDNITNPGGNFVFKHALNAITALDRNPNGIQAQVFLEKYKTFFYSLEGK